MMNQTPSAERTHEIDLLRGLACLAVVMFHFLYRGQLDGWVSGEVPAWLAWVSAHGYLGVHLFFMISGYVIFMSAQGATPRAFVASRVARLYPAYWVAALLTAGTAWLLASPTFSVSWQTLLGNLTMLTHLIWVGQEPPYVDGAYWSLAIEFQFYLIMLGLIVANRLARIERFMAGWLLLSSLDFLRPVYLAELLLVVEWAPLFCAGMLFYRIRERGLERQTYMMLWWCHFLVVARATAPQALRAGEGAPGEWSVALLLTAFFVIFWLVASRRWTMRASALTAWAGLLTYPVYLLHQNIGYMLLEWLRPLESSLLLRLLPVMALIVVASILLNRGVERPCGRWLRRRLAPSQPVPVPAPMPRPQAVASPHRHLEPSR